MILAQISIDTDCKLRIVFSDTAVDTKFSGCLDRSYFIVCLNLGTDQGVVQDDAAVYSRGRHAAGSCGTSLIRYKCVYPNNQLSIDGVEGTQ
eukprot:SAG31_NODE_250_length_19098_cov_4.337123_13_plen_92_part_00